MKSGAKLIPTIIIVVDPQASTRGFSMEGREFRLKRSEPIKGVAITTDGARCEGEYWVVSKDEYMRVVPEERNLDYKSDEIYIPTFLARYSFRPEYMF